MTNDAYNANNVRSRLPMDCRDGDQHKLRIGHALTLEVSLHHIKRFDVVSSYLKPIPTISVFLEWPVHDGQHT